ncbi:MAG: polysaccharide deacetylase family protein [Syntrophomonas sp.]
MHIKGFIYSICGIAILLLLVFLPCESLSTPYFEDRLIYEVKTKEKVVAITFDDGPHPIYTPQILDILDKYRIKASFFLIGSQMDKHPEIVVDIFARGHVVGNHTYHHYGNLKEKEKEVILSELKQWDQTMKKINGQKTGLFRPPRGFIGGDILLAAEDNGDSTIMWTICADNRNAPTPELMARRVEENIGPGGIILLHDGVSKARWKDVKASELIIKSLSAQGYRFVTIPELIELGKKEKE